MANNTKRFQRTEALLGAQAMKNLASSSVMIVGLGAVGGYVLEALARAGIGKLILVDFDVIEETNINRQILALSSSIGKSKVEVAKERVLEINPDCHVKTIEMFVNSETINDLLQNHVDMVIDAIDALNPKCCLMEELYKKGIPFISSMGAALKTNPACIKLTKLANSKNCGLARFIRKRLKKRGIDISKIDCVFSDEQVDVQEDAIFLDRNSENATISQGKHGRIRNTLGSLPTITAIFGLTIANQVILKLSNR